MPAPYSDNMYSNLGEDASDDERDALSPTDGYFHASSSSDAASSSQWQPHHDQQLPHHLSSNLPSVPNVLVEDPTLRGQGAADKAREAEEERLMNHAARHPASSSPYPPQVSTAAYPPISSSSQDPFPSPSAAATSSIPPFAASHHHRRSVDDDERLDLPGHSTRPPYLHTPANRGETSNITSRPHHHSQLDAPPAYSPSPSSPPLSASQHQGYQTFPSPPAAARTDTMGVPEEHQALLPRQPESMGGRLGSPPPSRWQRIKESMASSNRRKSIKTILGVLVVLSIIFAILGTFGLSSSSSHRRNRGIIDKDPVRDPDMGGHSDLEWSAPSGCRNTPHAFSKTTASLSFGGKQTLDIRQETEKNLDRVDGRPPRIFGQINIRPTGDDASEGSIELEVISNDEALRVQVEKDFRGDHQLFKMVTPRVVEWGSASGDAPCIQMRATVWVPRKAYLRSFTLNSVHLDVNVFDGLVMGVSGETKIGTVVGDFRTSLSKDVNEDVVPYTLESRKIKIETVSGDVKGWFPLYDLLKISTTSGDINTQVAPKPADEKSPESAVLDISSVSGHVEVVEPLNGALKAGKPDKKLPARDYITKLSTTSGYIKGEVASTSEGKFESTSGNTVLKVLPIFENDSRKYSSKPPSLTTNSMSGNWRVTLLEPLWTGTQDQRQHSRDTSHDVNSNAKPTLGFLKSNHQTISGTVRLFYPATWEGKFQAQSISGNVKISGDGVEIIRRDRGWKTHIEGKKGDGNSEMKLESMSGNMELVVGGKSS